MAENKNKKSKIVLLFLIFSFSLLILIARFLYIDITKSTNFPNLRTSEINTALRGSIISLDHFTLSSSKKLYKAEINTYNIDPNKKELFVKLFSIYSGMNPKRIMSKLNSHKGRVVLSYRIDSKRAFYLKELAKKLYNLKVFREYEDKRTKIIYRSGLDILESGEYRDYKYKDIFTPYIGYLQKRNDNKGFTRGFGVKGVEKYYDENLKPLQNGFIYGQKTVNID
jgi:cell division protein FtsI (penicillin-binding protein 3)